MITVAGYPGLVLANMVADVTQPVRAAPAFVDALKDKQEGVVHLASIDGKPFKVTSAGGRAPLFVGFDHRYGSRRLRANPATDSP